jgi:hypothetical protein
LRQNAAGIATDPSNARDYKLRKSPAPNTRNAAKIQIVEKIKMSQMPQIDIKTGPLQLDCKGPVFLCNGIVMTTVGDAF